MRPHQCNVLVCVKLAPQQMVHLECHFQIVKAISVNVMQGAHLTEVLDYTSNSAEEPSVFDIGNKEAHVKSS